MDSVQFDGTQLVNTTYTTRKAQHESMTNRDLDYMQLARDNGSILIQDRWGTKTIRLSGVLFGSSESDLESKIDSFKELFSRQEKNLDIDKGGTTRRYVATCTSFNFNRDYFNNTFAPWAAEFIVLSGDGKDTSTTTALDEYHLIADPVGTHSFTLSGSKSPQPTITLDGASLTYVKGIKFKNTDTGESITVTDDSDWDYNEVIINCEDKKVTLDGNEVDFYGSFPNFQIGTNNFEITAGEITCVQNYRDYSDIAAGTNTVNTTYHYAQSFEIPKDDDTFQAIELAISKTGSPGDLTWRIETDDNGEPSGTYASSSPTSEGTISAGDVQAGFRWITSYAEDSNETNNYENFSLEANTRYWLVLYAAGVDASNYYCIGYGGNASFENGKYLKSEDSGSSWTDQEKDLFFKILLGGRTATTNSLNVSVEYTKTYL